MSSQRNVLWLKIPFSTHNRKLKEQKRPYVCMTNLPDLRLVKCQTARIAHLNNRNAPPINRVVIHQLNNTPFTGGPPKILDCDKVFEILNVSFIDPILLRTTPGKPNAVSEQIFNDIKRKINRPNLIIHNLALNEVARLNNNHIR